ncbi:GntR family transcriptional regulator [Chitinophaga lutea]|uniref:GntR family transcriptional regulator n=1 Tax=Chitinophaga lutea TaxID=2488634 RepID=A0A3N4Q032_9BACT|nr:GntR family transcriptional regulator [Chitinophaga lutea]RPE12529.1 GntR family transcriptional regulator [Chitinophaga lutea]
MTFAIDHKSPVPLHIQTEDLLRKIIKQPQYQKGKHLPNEIELARTLNISRGTLRQAINKLVYEGLLTRKKGVGTKVNNMVSSRALNWLSFSQEMAVRGIPIKNFETHLSWVKPEESVRNFFDIKGNRKVLKLEKLRGRPEGPFVYFVSYFHPRIGLTGEEDFKRPLYEILESDYQVVADLSQEEISARAADKFLAGKLQLDTGSPILCRKRFVFDQAERPIEYNLGFYRADSFVYTIESRREQ